jgi:hypothetical protein
VSILAVKNLIPEHCSAINQIPSDKPVTYYAIDLFLSCARLEVPTEVLLKMQVF